MSQHYMERLEWYRELLARLPELTAEAEKRIEKFVPMFKDEIEEFRARFSQNRQVLPYEVEGDTQRGGEIIIPN